MQKPLKKAPFAKAKGAFGCSLNDLNFIKEQFMYFKKEYIDFFRFRAYTTVPEFRYKALVARMRDLLDENGKAVFAYYLPLELGKKPEKEYKATVVVEGIFEKPTLIDPYTGEAFRIEPTRIDGSMTVFAALPIKDYPLILTDENTFIIE